MLFIQFGAGGRGGKVFLTLMPTAWVASRAELQGMWGSSANLPRPCLAAFTHVLLSPLPACHLNKQCFYRALGKVSLSNIPALEGWLSEQCVELCRLPVTPSRPSERLTQNSKQHLYLTTWDHIPAPLPQPWACAIFSVKWSDCYLPCQGSYQH